MLFKELHEENNCDASDGCPCSQPVTLTTEHVESVLLTCNLQEQTQVTALRQLCAWGLSAVWKHLHDNDQLGNMIFPSFTPNEVERNSDEEEDVVEMDDLEKSLSRLHVSGARFDTAEDEADLASLKKNSAISHASVVESSYVEPELNIDSDLELATSDDSLSDLDETSDQKWIDR